MLKAVALYFFRLFNVVSGQQNEAFFVELAVEL